jgi:hypothetical protein
MPNVKIYVDEDAFADHKVALTQALRPIREIVSKYLGTQQSACQLALIAAVSLKDQPAVNVEIHVMPRPDRTKEILEAMGAEIQLRLCDVTGSPVAFRCAQLDPLTYVTLL